MQGATKVYETPLVQAKAVNVEGRDAVAVELDVPLAGLKPGSYVCQLNVIDDAGGSFAFPRFAVLVREPAAHANSHGAGRYHFEFGFDRARVDSNPATALLRPIRVF